MKHAIICLIAAALLAGCVGRSGNVVAETPAPAPSAASVSLPEQKPAPAPDKTTTATILAVGDNLIHDVIYQQAQRRREGDGYDFAPLYKHVAEKIRSADIASVNQETPLCGSKAPSNYPLFNSPPEVAATLYNAGFDVVTIANNHMLDQGADGLAETIETLRAIDGVTQTGAFLTVEEREEIPILERDDIKFAFLAYTQHTNGLSPPADKSYMIPMTSDEELIRAQIQKAREAADIVVLNVHWGEEYTTEPTALQRELAAMFGALGADIIFGHHPHVIEPMEWIENDDGHRTLVFYSLGNFVSAQDKPITMIGAMVETAVTKNHTSGEVTIAEPEITTLVTHYGASFSDLTVYAFNDYSEALASSHGVSISFGKAFSLQYILDTTSAVFGKAGGAR